MENVPVLILVFLVDAAHEGGRWGKHLIDEDEDGLLGGELDSLADDVDKLADGQIGRDQILLLVDGGDVALLNLFADDLYEACQHVVEGERWRLEGGHWARTSAPSFVVGWK